MELRATPDHFRSRDYELFPALERARRKYDVPAGYKVQLERQWVIIHIWDFYVEEKIRLRLKRLYDQYTDWWIDPSNPLRRQSPVFLGVPDFRADTILYVHHDHARWWIDLFNEAAPFLEERARLFPNQRDEYKQALWEREHPDVRREEQEAQAQKHEGTSARARA